MNQGPIHREVANVGSTTGRFKRRKLRRCHYFSQDVQVRLVGLETGERQQFGIADRCGSCSLFQRQRPAVSRGLTTSLTDICPETDIRLEGVIFAMILSTMLPESGFQMAASTNLTVVLTI